ncbi:MAG: hypothetical protein QM774_12355 [Gordonia sp. (in: high G+C Gram-positive bacteria)]|uniref:hypothetical protein n=1 Tax=Gordonia sp. (in: high G+C Gram-positive bacteria) TaxID=84139 RepID=UPI0039E4973B
MTQPPEQPQDPQTQFTETGAARHAAPTEAYSQADYPPQQPAPEPQYAPHYQTTQYPEPAGDDYRRDEDYHRAPSRRDEFDEDPRRTIRRWQIISGIAIATAALIGLAFLLFGTMHDSKAASTTTTVTSTTTQEESVAPKTVTKTVDQEHDTVETTTVTQEVTKTVPGARTTETTTVTCEPKADGNCLVQ